MRTQDTLQRNRIRKFVKTSLEVRMKPEHLIESQEAKVIDINGTKQAADVEVKQELPLFLTAIYKGRDYDPL